MHCMQQCRSQSRLIPASCTPQYFPKSEPGLTSGQTLTDLGLMHSHGMCLRKSPKVPPLRRPISAALHPVLFYCCQPRTPLPPPHPWAVSEGVAELSSLGLLGRGSDSESTGVEKEVTPYQQMPNVWLKVHSHSINSHPLVLPKAVQSVLFPISTLLPITLSKFDFQTP